MADNVEIQGLGFEVVGEVSGATKGLKALKNTLTSLKKVTDKGLGLHAVVGELKEFNEAVGEMDNSGITGMAQAIQTISGSVRRLSAVRGHLQAISELDFSNVNTAAEAITNIANASGMGRQNVEPQIDGATDGGAETEHVDEELDDAASSGERLHAVLSRVAGIFSSVGSAAASATQKIGGAFVGGVKKAASGAWTLTKAMFTLPFKRVGRSLSNVVKPLQQFTSSLGRIALYRGVRAIIAGISQALKEGIGYLNLYSRSMGTQFHKSLNSLATDALYLKGAFATVAEPLINTLAPVIDMITEKIVSLMNLVAQLFAALSGKSTYTKAVKTATEYTDSISKAADKTKSFLADFDELNVFDDSNSKKDELPDWGHMFEQAPVDLEIGDFTKKIRELVESEEWRKVGETIGDKVNKWFDGIDWDSIGRNLGKKINAAIEAAYGFLKKTDFRKIGNHVAELVNGVFSEINFNTAGRLFTRSITAMLDFIIGFVEKLDWKLLGKSLGDFFRGAFDEAYEWIVQYDWAQFGRNIWQHIKDFFEGIDATSLARSFFRLLGAALGAGVSFIAGFVEGVVEDIVGYFRKFIYDDDGMRLNGIDLIKGLLKGIWEGIKDIGKWIKDNVLTPFVDGFKSAFKIHSPSVVMQEIGYDVVLGLYKGIKDKISEGVSIIKGWATSVYNWFTGSDGSGTIFEKFRNAAQNIVSGFKDKINTTYTTVRSAITTWATGVRDWFTGAGYGGVNANTFSSYANTIITSFKDKVSSTYSTVKSSITTWAASVKSWFSDSGFGGVNATTWGTYASNVITGFKDKISSTYSTVKTSITTWASNVKDWFTNSSFGGVNRTTFETYATNVIDGFKNKVSSTYTNVKSSITTWATSVKDWFSNGSYGGVNSTTFASYADNIITGFKNKITSTYSTVQSSITTWASNVKTWFTNTVSSTAFGTIASDIVTGFKNGITNNTGASSAVKTAMTTWASSVKSWFTNTVSQSAFYQVASDVVTGFKNGIGALYSTCRNSIETWGSSIISWFKAKLNSNSPSKVFEQIGKDTVLGYNIGLQDLGDTTKKIVGNWADTFTNISPTMSFAVDTSALRYYDSSSFAKSISPSVNSNNVFSAAGVQEAMTEFYQEFVAPVMLQMADDMRRQADKREQTVVQIGNRTITDAVTTQESANGYKFVKTGTA